VRIERVSCRITIDGEEVSSKVQRLNEEGDVIAMLLRWPRKQIVPF
jgi:hypothetical protein